MTMKSSLSRLDIRDERLFVQTNSRESGCFSVAGGNPGGRERREKQLLSRSLPSLATSILVFVLLVPFARDTLVSSASITLSQMRDARFRCAPTSSPPRLAHSPNFSPRNTTTRVVILSYAASAPNRFREGRFPYNFSRRNRGNSPSEREE